MKKFLKQYKITEIILETISIFLLIFFSIYIYNNWSSIPKNIPSHFNWYGQADSWAPKGYLPFMLYFSIGAYIIFSILSVFPRVIHFPVQITPENEEKQLHIRFSMICWFKMELVLMSCYIGWQSMRIALGKSEALSPFFLPAFLSIILLTIAFFLYQGFQNK